MSKIILIKRTCFARTFNRRGLKVPRSGTFNPSEKRTQFDFEKRQDDVKKVYNFRNKSIYS